MLLPTTQENATRHNVHGLRAVASGCAHCYYASAVTVDFGVVSACVFSFVGVDLLHFVDDDDAM